MIHENLDYFRGIHKGHRGWLVCPGPSLDTLNRDLILPDDIVLACNQAPIALERWDYGFATDGAYLEMNCRERCTELASRGVILASEGWMRNPKALALANTHVMSRDYEAGKKAYRLDPDAKLLIEGEDCSQPACHMLVVMGCSPIILAGVDCRYRGHQKYCKPLPGVAEWGYTTVSCGRKVGEWTDPGGFKISETWNGWDDGALSGAGNYWARIADNNPNLDIRLAQPWGRLQSLFKCL